MQRQRSPVGLWNVNSEHQTHSSVLSSNVGFPFSQLNVRIAQLQYTGTVNTVQKEIDSVSSLPDYGLNISLSVAWHLLVYSWQFKMIGMQCCAIHFQSSGQKIWPLSLELFIKEKFFGYRKRMTQPLIFGDETPNIIHT